MQERPALIRFLRYAARTILIIVALFWFGFAVMSGAENGIGDLVANLPNALPWLGLFIIVFVAFRWEILGGALAVLAGVASIFFFNAWTAPVVLVGISLPIIGDGTVLIICHFLDRSDQDA